MKETVLITGASSGIGLELARCFAADGCRLILVARNVQALETLAAELRQKHQIDVIVMRADLSQRETPKRIFSDLTTQKVLVDIVVNNAGFGAIGVFEHWPAERLNEMIQVNVGALTELTRLFVPGMVQRGSGGVLNVGSVAGFIPGGGMAVYYATKAYVLSFSEALAAELAGTGVKVSVLCPGPVPTNFGAVAGSKHVDLIRVSGRPADLVARDGHKAFRKGRTICISGGQNKFLVFLIRWVPRALIRRIVLRFNGFRRA
ncbi:MAG TPA: SDR family oxidoreductase [Desulfuromonadaceae bacterium]|nr:SDR family oxidoreductase [Desulfuromonadaceae bacterium]